MWLSGFDVHLSHGLSMNFVSRIISIPVRYLLLLEQIVESQTSFQGTCLDTGSQKSIDSSIKSTFLIDVTQCNKLQ